MRLWLSILWQLNCRTNSHATFILSLWEFDCLLCDSQFAVQTLMWMYFYSKSMRVWLSSLWQLNLRTNSHTAYCSIGVFSTTRGRKKISVQSLMCTYFFVSLWDFHCQLCDNNFAIETLMCTYFYSKSVRLSVSILWQPVLHTNSHATFIQSLWDFQCQFCDS